MLQYSGAIFLYMLLLNYHPTLTDVSSGVEHLLHREEQNLDSDHKAFLGEEAAKTFDHLTPDESIEKLGNLFHLVDEQVVSDGQITEEEMIKWLRHVQFSNVRREAESQMKETDDNRDGFVTWDEFFRKTYAVMDEDKYSIMVQKDQKRFEQADTGEGDGKLNLDEFSAFLHPGNYDHMSALVINETLEDIDTDGDRKISLKEYIADLQKGRRHDEENELMDIEKDEFTKVLDNNKDGMLDEDEIGRWILPTRNNDSTSEAKHLIAESDRNGDGMISRDEMLKNYYLFVGSQASDFGEMLKEHNEL